MKLRLIHSIIIAIFSVLPMYAQQSTITVLDESTGEACSYATVVLLDMNNNIIKSGTSDERGTLSFQLDQDAIVAVSFMGYESTYDTISPGESITISLITSSFEMEQVVVTGQYTPRPVDKSIYRIDIVDSRSMHERGVNNLAEALAAETSIRLKIDPSTGSHIIMQGMGGENIKYLIDGIPLVGRVRGEIDLSQIDMENVDHIEIVHGPMSVQYGSGAIAGVINIITKKSNYFSNVLKINSYTGTPGTYNMGLYGSMKKKSHQLILSANRNMFQGFDLDLNVDAATEDVHDRYMEFKPKLVYNGNLSYTYRKKDLVLDIKSHFMHTEVRDYANYIEKVSIAYDNYYFTTRSTNTISLSNKISKAIAYDICASYTWYGRQTLDLTSDLSTLTRIVTDTAVTTFNNFMTRSGFAFASPDRNWSLLTGWDINLDKGTGDKMEEDASIGDFVWYGSAQYSPLKDLSIQPGIRFIYNTKYGAPIIPSLNIQWNMNEAMVGRISYARGFRAPSLKELYIDFRDSNHNIFGNKNLKAETTNSYNFNLQYKKKLHRLKLKSDISFYFNDGKDVIGLKITDVSNNSATYDNIDFKRTFGGEISVSFDYTSHLTIGGGLSRTGESIKYLDETEFTPPELYNNYSLDARYTIPVIDVTLFTNLKFYGRTPALYANETDGSYYWGSTAPYGDLDFSLSRMFWKNNINLVVGGKNMLNVKGVKVISDVEYLSPKNVGRMWYIKMNLKLSK